MRGDPSKRNLFIKNCVFIVTHLKFCHHQSALHLMQCTYWDIFSTAQNSFWTHQFWCLLELLPFFNFLFHHFHVSKTFAFEDFFIQGNQKNHAGHAIFGQKLLNTQHRVGRCACKSPVMKWANVLKESSKILTEAKRSLSQQRQLVHWYRWVPRTLT